MNKIRSILLVGTAALILMGAGCATDTTTDTNTTISNTEETTTNEAVVATDTVVADDDTTITDVAVEVDEGTDAEEATDVAATTKTFDVVASKFQYSPSTITVSEGDTVVLNLTTSDVPHGFSLSAFDLNETITPGKTKAVEFVANQTGTFNFSCSVVCGSGHGSMAGTLIVE